MAAEKKTAEEARIIEDLEERVGLLEADQTYSQRLSDLEDRIKRMEKAVTSQLGARLQ